MPKPTSSGTWQRLIRRARRVVDEKAVGRLALGAVGRARPDSEAFSGLLSRMVAPASRLLDHPAARQDAIAAASHLLWTLDDLGEAPQIPDEASCAQITSLFHQLYYYDDASTWRKTAYRGVHIQKCPLDLWRYMEILARVRPDLVIETDAKGGGTALLIADLCGSQGAGRVVTMGIEDDPEWPSHPRVTYWHGESMDPLIIRRAVALAEQSAVTLVLANSSHDAEIVRRELETYGPLVTPGSYMIVENTNIHGHPVRPDLPDGPMEGVCRFLAGCDEFEVDRDLESYRLTFNPLGYLRKRVPED